LAIIREFHQDLSAYSTTTLPVMLGKDGGSGLGLAIAKKIVEDHGGEIYLDERNETGTLFNITIPFGIPEGAIMSAGPIPSRRKSRKHEA
jgi:hypothetical protein